MERMMLYLDKSKQPADNRTMTFPIYKLDFDKLKTMTTIQYGDSVDNIKIVENGGYLQEVTSAPREPCYYTRIAASSGSLYQCLSTNIPKQAWQEGSINRYRISPMIQDEYNIYAINPEYFNFERVEGETPPDDWNDSFWYWKETIQSFTYNGVPYQYYVYEPHYPTQSGGYSQNETWIRDIDHKLGAKFYTDSGYSFGWVWQPFIRSSSNNGARSHFGDNMSTLQGLQFLGWRKPETPSTTNEGIRVKTNKPYIDPPWVSDGYIRAIIPFNKTNSADKYKLLTGDDSNLYNYTAFFVSFYLDNIPFYGIAVTHTDTYGENATPQSIEIIAFTPDFWGGSIISGGGDEGEWGQDSTTGGGGGTFDYVSDNRGDTPQTSIEAIIGARIENIYSVMSTYNKFVVSPSEFTQIMGVLQGTDYISRYLNTMYNPLSAIIAVNWIPSTLCAESNDLAILTASGFNISEHINYTNPPQFKKNKVIGLHSFDTIDLEPFSDSFADFEPYTKAVLHLPYIGELEISVNAIAHGKIKVTYVCDNISGNCVAFVWCQDMFGNCTYKYTASGNCAYTLPVFANRQDGSAVGKLIGSAVNLLGGDVASAGIGAIGAITRLAIPKRATTVNGSFGGNVGLIGDSICWLEIVHPMWVQPNNFQELNGIPSELSGTLFDDMSDNHTTYDGYTVVSEIHLENVDCTENEKTMIEAALKRGVHIHSERY